jgi:hypothetical protein
MLNTSMTIAAAIIFGLMCLADLAIVGFALDAILSRLFDLPRVLRHRRSGVRTGVGELGILLGLGAGISAESCQDSSIRLWLVVLVFVGLVMRFIGEAASKDIEQS